MEEEIQIIENFITPQFETELCSEIKRLLESIPEKETPGLRNKILRFGAKGIYDDHYKDIVIPQIFDVFKKDIDFNSLSINEYLAGQLIKYHIDVASSGKIITVLSLMSDTTMKFKLRNKMTPDFEFLLPARSLVKFWGSLRTKYQHSVLCENHRYSVVFRNSENI